MTITGREIAQNYRKKKLGNSNEAHDTSAIRNQNTAENFILQKKFA